MRGRELSPPSSLRTSSTSPHPPPHQQTSSCLSTDVIPSSSSNPAPHKTNPASRTVSIFPPQPSTTRASPTPLSVSPKGDRLVYASGKSIFLRSIDDPSISTQYTGHTAPTTVARFSPSGFFIASGDANGTIRVWDAVGEDMITKGEFPIISGAIKDLAWDGEGADAGGDVGGGAGDVVAAAGEREKEDGGEAKGAHAGQA